MTQRPKYSSVSAPIQSLRSQEVHPNPDGTTELAFSMSRRRLGLQAPAQNARVAEHHFEKPFARKLLRHDPREHRAHLSSSHCIEPGMACKNYSCDSTAPIPYFGEFAVPMIPYFGEGVKAGRADFRKPSSPNLPRRAQEA